VKLIQIELLGQLRITLGKDPLTSVNTNRMRSLLAFLVLHHDVPQSRERLAFLLWPESNEAQARTNLRQLLYNLRRALPVDCSLLVADNHTVQWKADKSCAIDVIEFEAAVRDAAGVKESDVAAAREKLEEAARLYQDDLLPDLYDEWLEPRRAQLRQQFADVLSRLTGLLEMLGEYPAAIRHATRLVALDSLRESYYQSLMRLHLRNHDRSSALRVYHQCMRNLQRELGVSPSKSMQEMLRKALKSEELPSAPAELPPYAATKPFPMVGRQTEWERLQDCWRRVTEGEAHFALIMGEPGIGKSRLAEKLCDWCAGNSKNAAVRARCYFAQGQLAYGPITELLRAEPMRAARTQLPLSQLAELARLLPEILAENPGISPPQPLTESWQRLHLYEAMNAVFRKVSKPLLLVIDDLQWCDRHSFEWLQSLFRSGSDGGILAVGTARMEETGREHALAGLVRELRQAGQLSELALTPLSIEETEALADAVAAHNCAPAFLSDLYKTTKGNPLFVVETMRASIEGDGNPRSVPPRVQAVIAARFAQLSPPAYELAGLAATIGGPFSFELLAKATDWDEESLSRALEELWQRRIIDGQGAAVYDYTHDLLREVANAELSPIRRRSLHQRIARALEELHGPEPAGVSAQLAGHYEGAGMAGQAIRFYGVAALVAKQRFADAESADLMRRALRLCREFPETAKRDQEELELLLRLGPSLVTTHGYSVAEVGETYHRSLELSRRLKQTEHLFAVLSGAWLFHIVRGELEQSRKLAQECVDCARDAGKLPQEMAGHFLLGTSLFHLGRLAASWEQIELAASSSEVSSHPALALFAGPDVAVFSRAYVAHLLCQSGDADGAVNKSDEAVLRAREVAHPFTLAIALDYAAMLHVYRCECGLALVRAEEAAAICGKHGFAYYLAVAEILAGWAIGMQSDPSAGMRRLYRGLDALKATGAELRLPFYYGLLGEICGRAGQTGEALANVASGFAFLSKNGEMWAAPELHRIHGDLLLRGGDDTQAQASYRRAIATASQIGSRLFENRATDRLRALAIKSVEAAEP
jgi:DNA-binding SARP family transcriptional activator/predicted ATPase